MMYGTENVIVGRYIPTQRPNYKNRITQFLAEMLRFLRSVHRLLVAASVVPSSLIVVTLMKRALSSSITSVLTRATRRNTPEDTILQTNYTELSPSGEATGCSVTQHIMKHKAQYHVHRNLPRTHIVTQIYAAQLIPSCLRSVLFYCQYHDHKNPPLVAISNQINAT
jgi:hypothetical protein